MVLCRRLSFAGLMLAMLAQPVPGDNKALTMRDAVSITKMQYFADRRYQSLHHQKFLPMRESFCDFPPSLSAPQREVVPGCRN
jgi:hypothetical protein